MATPGEIRDQALSDLRALLRGMTDPEYLLSLDDATSAVKKEAALKLLATHHARVKLENEALAGIRDKLVENEDDFADATQEINTALRTLDDVKTVLKAATALLNVLAKVLTLLA